MAVGDMTGDGRLDVVGITQTMDGLAQVDVALQSPLDPPAGPPAPGTDIATPQPASFPSAETATYEAGADLRSALRHRRGPRSRLRG